VHPQPTLIAATFPDIAGRVLRDANCVLPLAVKTRNNDRGSVTLLITNQATPAAAFAPYFDAFLSQLNKTFPVGDSAWLPFRLAPNEVQLAIHSLPIAVIQEDPNKVFPCLAESILNSKDIRILAARYLNLKAESREGKTATSVIVSVHPGDVPTMGSSIRHFSRSPTIERAYSSNRYMQCKTAGDTVMSPLDAHPLNPSAPSAPSTTLEPRTDVPTPPALEVATLRLLLAVALPHHPAASTAAKVTLPFIRIAKAARHRPLSGIPPLPPRSFLCPPLVTKWTGPPTTTTSRPAFAHPLTPVSVRDGYSKGQKSDCGSGPLGAHPRRTVTPSRRTR